MSAETELLLLEKFTAEAFRDIDDPALKRKMARRVSDFLLSQLTNERPYLSLGDVEAKYPELAKFLHEVRPYND